MWFAVLSILFYLISALRIAPILLTSQVAGMDVKTSKNTVFFDRTFGGCFSPY